jgi:hypothetical protein
MYNEKTFIETSVAWLSLVYHDDYEYTDDEIRRNTSNYITMSCEDDLNNNDFKYIIQSYYTIDRSYNIDDVVYNKVLAYDALQFIVAPKIFNDFMRKRQISRKRKASDADLE